MTRCNMPYPYAPSTHCCLPVGHDGPHVTRDGGGWNDSDDMDGGVAAALIEKEVGRIELADDPAYWHARFSDARQQRDEAVERAEKHRRAEVDHRNNARCWMKTSEEWQATAEEWEKRALAAEHRALTPDAITTEDLRGVVRVVVIGPNGRDYDRGDLYSHGARAVIEDYGHTLKVFAAPPLPPEWADLAGVLGDLDVSALVDTDDLARQAHARGVRVVTEEQP